MGECVELGDDMPKEERREVIASWKFDRWNTALRRKK
jgi:hypothetical protein